ncbi:hypothetical protein Nepgr_023179 [Nepenthes gracilis]|uniref:Uncharacterized protein n=1 Tax=Nepenthes gracilis TaxID=150966 RepID=A0AAD3T240_NEPGR|nr:hypothetical protein Nepgr_023179 [Nepenthes gracilis]
MSLKDACEYPDSLLWLPDVCSLQVVVNTGPDLTIGSISVANSTHKDLFDESMPERPVNAGASPLIASWSAVYFDSKIAGMRMTPSHSNISCPDSSMAAAPPRSPQQLLAHFDSILDKEDFHDTSLDALQMLLEANIT